MGDTYNLKEIDEEEASASPVLSINITNIKVENDYTMTDDCDVS